MDRLNKALGIKSDCYFYNNGECKALCELVCRKDNCSFFKTKEQETKDRLKYGYNPPMN